MQPIADRLLDIPEGLYLIFNAAEGRVVESEHCKPNPSLLHAYAAPFGNRLSTYQLWIVFQKDGTDKKYTLRNFATGAALDVDRDYASYQNHVRCWASNGKNNQAWEFYGSKQSQL